MVKQNTSERILDVTQELIQSRGYSAISFSDIAEKVGIKKPSIMHHYPSKAALGVAVVDRYQRRFASMFDGILADRKLSAAKILDIYFSPYLNLGQNKEKVCLCGALAGEYMALPDELKEEITRFFEDSKKWLVTILDLGKDSCEFSFESEAEIIAALILDSLQGSLMIGRATSNKAHVEKTIEALKSELGLQDSVAKRIR